MCAGAEHGLQALPDVGEADALASAASGFGESGAVIGDAHLQLVAATSDADDHRTAFREWIQAVLDGIFHQRDQHHRRERRR